MPVEPNAPVSVGSHTSTVSSFAPSTALSVMSITHGSFIDSCGTSSSSWPRNACARKSTESKCRSVRTPGFFDTLIVRRYQRNSSGARSRPTPESFDSSANGTTILPCHAVGRATVFEIAVTA